MRTNKMIPLFMALAIHAAVLAFFSFNGPKPKVKATKTFDLTNITSFKKNSLIKKTNKIVEFNNKVNSNEVAVPSTIASNSVAVNSSEKNESSNLFLYYAQPEYPAIARKLGTEGIVKIKIFYDQSGQILKIDLLQSSGSNLLDDSVLKAASKWRLNQSSNGSFEKTFIFKLNN